VRIRARILFTSLIIIFGQILSGALPAHSVEFGQDATGDPNAVKVGGGSGFLYSERIIITVAHVIDGRGVAYWESNGRIYNPGIVSIAGQRWYGVKKVLIPSTYVKPDYRNNIIIDDLAIIILYEDIPLTKKAVLATEEQMQRFVKEKSKVELVGYGITDGSQRSSLSFINNRSPNKLTSTLISPEAVVQFFVQHRELQQSHICDGDSGSVFFVEENNVRYVLGTTGLGLINNNCPPPQYDYPSPSMSWIDPNSKLRDLLKTAEKIVEEDKKIELANAEELRFWKELAAKQEADAKLKKTTITCLNGKLFKKVTAVKPVCPKGYKKK